MRVAPTARRCLLCVDARRTGSIVDRQTIGLPKGKGDACETLCPACRYAPTTTTRTTTRAAGNVYDGTLRLTHACLFAYCAYDDDVRACACSALSLFVCDAGDRRDEQADRQFFAGPRIKRAKTKRPMQRSRDVNIDGGGQFYPRRRLIDDRYGPVGMGGYVDNDGVDAVIGAMPNHVAWADQRQYDDDENDTDDNEQGHDQDQLGNDGASADLVDLMGEDVFLLLLQSLVAQGRAGDLAALCSSSQRARDVCQRARVNWARDFPDLAAAYGGGGGENNEMLRGVPASAAAVGMAQPSVLQTALAMRRQHDARLAQERFCVLYALYAQAVTRRVAIERQRAHALDLESGAAMQTARNVEQARTEARSAAAPMTAGRSSRSPGSAFGRILRGMVPSRSARSSRSAFRASLQREVEPHPDVADVLRSPADMTLGDLLEWAHGVEGVSGYVLGGFDGGAAPWHVTQLADEQPVPYGDPRLRYFYVTSMDPPPGAIISLDDRRLIGRDVASTLRADVDRAVARSDARQLRTKVEHAVNESLRRALIAPGRARFAPQWARSRGVPRPQRNDEEEDMSLATLRALDQLSQRCAGANLFEAFAPVSTYLAVRPFGSTNNVTYDIIVGLPLA